MYFTNSEIDSILNMEYNPKYEYKDEDYLCNDIFNENNLSLLEEEMRKWRYDKEKFLWGRENKKLFPSLMIYLILSTFKYKQIISLDMYEKVVVEKYKVTSSSIPYTDEQILIGRAYQTYTSYLREVDVILKLIKHHPEIKVFKNPYLDICGGIDFKIIKNNMTKYLAIKHEGRTTEKYDRMWKNKKEEISPYDIIRVTAKHNNGDLIETINEEDIIGVFI